MGPFFDGRAVFGDPLPHHASTRHRYSLINAMRRAADPGNKGRIGGLEGEVSDEIQRRSDRAASGFYVPFDAPIPRDPGVSRRDLNLTTGAGGVATITDADQLIELLRAKSVCCQLGATMPILGPGISKVPRIATGDNVYWVTEGSDPPASSPVMDGVTFNPKTVGGFVDTTRVLLASAPSGQAILIGDLLSAVAHEIDRVALAGSGSGAEPKGLANNTDIGTYGLGTNGAAITRADLVAMEKTVGNAKGDAAADASMAFVTTADGRAKLRSTEAVATSGRFLWDDDDRAIGKAAVATTALPNNLTKGSGTGLSALLYGNFTNLQISQWGAIDILVNPYAFSLTGYVRINALLDVDCQTRQAASFLRVKDFLTV